jgi:predicted transcriptional regulator YheO
MSHTQQTQAAYIVLEGMVRKGGRPKALTGKHLAIAQSLYDDPKNSIPETCRTLKISRATLYRSLKTREDTSRL